jgi:hypothetical protein
MRLHSGAAELGLKPDDFPHRIEIPMIFPIEHAGIPLLARPAAGSRHFGRLACVNKCGRNAA